MRKNFVTFYSPGTFVAEESTLPIDSWDTELAVEMSKSILERYDAKPYGFRFITRERDDNELDSRVVERSSMYYLGGEVVTIRQLKEANKTEDRILISNMEINGWDKVIVNNNSWKSTHPLMEGDVILNVKI